MVGFGSRAETLAQARELGAIDTIATDARAAVAEAELVIVCAPVGSVAQRVCELAPHCLAGTLITDAGSTKAEIVAAVEQAAAGGAWPPDVRFLGSHPLAGNEKKGPAHAAADLFVGRTVILTPTAGSREADRRRLTEFWQALGASVIEMTAEEHDRALAVTSHLPHLVAAALASATPEGFLRLTAGGWHDTTRIAGGDPQLWRQILLSNRGNVVAALEQLLEQLGQWREALEKADPTGLEQLLAAAKQLRDAAVDADARSTK